MAGKRKTSLPPSPASAADPEADFDFAANLAESEQMAEQARQQWKQGHASGREENTPQQATGKRVFRPTPLSVIKGRPFPIDCIDGILPETGLAILGGASGDGKSFLALDMAAHIVHKLAWFGREVDRARPVQIYYLENPQGIKQRVLAWEAENGKRLDDGCGLDFFEVSLDMAEDVQSMIDAAPHDAVIIIDTLRKANPALNENSPEGMGEILKRANMLLVARRDLLILFIHHVPKTSGQSKDDRNRLAGHYSLAADVDAVLLTSRSGAERNLYIGKSREAEDGAGFAYKLNPHTVGKDAKGKDVTSVAIEWTGIPAKATRNRAMGKAERYAIKSLQQLQCTAAEEGIQFDDWKEAFAELFQNDNPRDFSEATENSEKLEKKYQDNIRKNFDAGKGKLLDAGRVKIRAGKIVEILKSLEG